MVYFELLDALTYGEVIARRAAWIAAALVVFNLDDNGRVYACSYPTFEETVILPHEIVADDWEISP